MMLALTALAFTLLAAAPALADGWTDQGSTAVLNQVNQGDVVAANALEQDIDQRQFAPGGDVAIEVDPVAASWDDSWGGEWDHNGGDANFEAGVGIDANGGAGGTQEAVQVAEQTAVAVGPTFDATQSVDSSNWVGQTW